MGGAASATGTNRILKREGKMSDSAPDPAAPCGAPHAAVAHDVVSLPVCAPAAPLLPPRPRSRRRPAPPPHPGLTAPVENPSGGQFFLRLPH